MSGTALLQLQAHDLAVASIEVLDAQTIVSGGADGTLCVSLHGLHLSYSHVRHSSHVCVIVCVAVCATRNGIPTRVREHSCTARTLEASGYGHSLIVLPYVDKPAAYPTCLFAMRCRWLGSV